MKPCYKEMLKRVSKRINSEKKDFIFAMAADSHLDNSLSDTIENIKMTDRNVKFDCIVHLGDFMNGNLPKSCTKRILRNQLLSFKNSVGSGVFYPVQGNHDGYFDEIKHHSCDMAIDEDWYELTDFLGEYENIHREKNKPYYYVDYPEKKIRLIVLCSFYYTGFYDGTTFCKQYGTDEEQLEWFEKKALDLQKGWTVMIFSHDVPFKDMDKEPVEDNMRINGGKLFDSLLVAKDGRGFDVAAWFIGHFHGDLVKNIKGINFVLLASETAYEVCLWDMPRGGYFPKRVLNTETEDLWDTVILNKEERKITTIRFGSGEDRVIYY